MKVYSFLFLVLFLSLEYYFVDFLTAFQGRAIYLFEVLFVILSFPFFKFKIPYKKLSSRQWLIISFPSILTGLIVALSCRAFEVVVPFDLKHGEALSMLLILGPILEEFLYRFAIWNHLKQFFKDQYMVMIFVSILFSFGHFYAYLNASEVYRPFIIFQTIYTFFLSVIIGLDWMAHRNFCRPVLIHIFFNSGFFLGLIA